MYDDHEIRILQALMGEDDNKDYMYWVNIRSTVERLKKEMRLSHMKEYQNKMETEYNFK